MTAPAPPGSSGGVIGTARSLPIWGWVLIAAASGVVVYWFVSERDPAPDDDRNRTDKDKTKDCNRSGVGPTWEQRARQTLLSRGYSRMETNTALGKYLRGGTMTPQDQSMVAIAIGQFGTPDIPNNDPSYATFSPQTQPGPGAPAAGNADTGYNSGVGNQTAFDSDNPVNTYWYVPSSGFGYTSTYRGLANQYYGDESKATVIMAANPGVVTSVWERIPPGVITKVPRNVNA